MKKFLSLIMAIVSAITFASCSTNPTDSSQDSSHESSVENKVSYWEQNENYGLQVKDGTLTLNAEPFYGIGANCYSLFNKGLFSNFKTDIPFAMLETMKEYGVPVIRFNCGVFYASEMYYLSGTYKAKAFDILKQIVTKAEELHIGLLPSFFWNIRCASDYVGEQLAAWGDQESKTRQFMREYTTEIVNLLKDSKAIFGWEFGNEVNNLCEIPPEYWMDAEGMSRAEAEQMMMTSTDAINAFEEFADIVAENDPHDRMITNGNAILRNTQYAQHTTGAMSFVDTEEQHHEMNLKFTPGKMNVVSEHNYIFEYQLADGELSLYELMKNSIEKYKRQGKAYIVGEFAVLPSDNDKGNTPEEKYAKSSEMFRTMMSTKVQLSFIWNYDKNLEIEYSFSEKEERGQYLLQLLKQYNLEYQEIIADIA